jgi:acyl-CoA thioesterase
VERVGPSRFRGQVSERWNIGTNPNGGYILAIALAAARASVAQPHPLTTTAHYLSPCGPGPVDVDVDVLKEGRTLSTLTARLVQAGRTRLVVVATYGDLSRQHGPTVVTIEPPDLPPPDQCGADRPFASGFAAPPPITQQVSFLPSPATAERLRTRSSDAHLEGWIGFVDGRPVDVHALPLLVDASPPAVFAAVETGWVPTLELTVHARGLPAPGPLRASIRTRAVIDGLLEEDCELWDSAGRLVAMSRQLAVVLPPA